MVICWKSTKPIEPTVGVQSLHYHTGVLHKENEEKGEQAVRGPEPPVNRENEQEQPPRVAEEIVADVEPPARTEEAIGVPRHSVTEETGEVEQPEGERGVWYHCDLRQGQNAGQEAIELNLPSHTQP